MQVESAAKARTAGNSTQKCFEDERDSVESRKHGEQTSRALPTRCAPKLPFWDTTSATCHHSRFFFLLRPPSPPDMLARFRLDISIGSYGHGSLSRFLCSTHTPSIRLSRLRLRAITGTTPENTLLGNLRQRAFQTYAPRQADNSSKNEQTPPKGKLLNKLKLPDTLRENIYTIPNLLTVSRILACPLLGYFIVQGNYVYATSLLAYAGLTDLVCILLLLSISYNWITTILPRVFERLTDGWRAGST